MIGDGSGNEVMVAGALFSLLSMLDARGVTDVTIPDGTPNAVEFGLDFMKSRYRITVSQVPDSEEPDD